MIISSFVFKIICFGIVLTVCGGAAAFWYFGEFSEGKSRLHRKDISGITSSVTEETDEKSFFETVSETIAEKVQSVLVEPINLAQDVSVQSGVSGLRTPAIVAALDGATGVEICNSVFDTVSKEGAWYWDTGVMCARDTLVHASGLTAAGSSRSTGGIDGDLCCFARGDQWAVWGGVSDADGSGSDPPMTGADIYCADSSGFVGGIDLSVRTNLDLRAAVSCR